MARLTQEKLDEIRSTLDDLGTYMERRRDEARDLFQNLDDIMTDIGRLQEELNDVDNLEETDLSESEGPAQGEEKKE